MYYRIKLELFLILIVIILTAFIPFRTAFAQFPGNPVGFEKGIWSIGLSADMQNYSIDNYVHHSFRGLIKADFALNNYFSAALIAGSANMRIDYPVDKLLEQFRAENSFVAGVSLKGQYPIKNIQDTKAFFETGLIRFSPFGTTNVIDDDEELFLEYIWNEYWTTAGVIIETRKNLNAYVGVQGRVVRHYEEGTRNKYRSGILPGLLAGLELKLPKKYIISVQLRFLNETAFSIGISQNAILTK